MTAPERITGVSHGMFSVARHYGGATFQGKSYIYNPVTDELVRADVLKAEAKAAKAAKTADKAAKAADAQRSLI